jgi:hypothetical protein
LQATNATAMTIMTVYVTDTLRLNVMWAGRRLPYGRLALHPYQEADPR